MEYNLVVDFKNRTILPRGTIKLVKNDYNSYVINYKFDDEFKNYKKVVSLRYPSTKKLILELEDDKLDLKNYLNEEGKYQYELSCYGEDSKLTNYAIGEFEVRSELVKESDEEVEIDDRVPILDQLINDTTKAINDTNQVIKVATDLKNEVIELDKNISEAEDKRNSNEDARIENEKNRVEDEEKRKNNEENRITAENERKNAEQIRIASEDTREENENIRVQNEDERLANENAREEYVNQLKKDVDDGKFNGECNFATFTINIETGNLEMNKTEDLLLDFAIENGKLEVII